MPYFYFTEADLCKCSLCNKDFKEPKLLPCGNTICEACELKIRDDLDKDKSYSCGLCQKIHNFNEDELPVMQAIKKIKKINATLNYQQLLALFKIENGLKEIDETKECAESKIKTYCDNLRFQIDTYFESHITELNQQREKLLSDVNNFEKKRIDEINKWLNATSSESLKTTYEEITKSLLQNELSKDDRDKIMVQENALLEKLVEEKKTIESLWKNDMLVIKESNIQTCQSSFLYSEICSIDKSITEKLSLIGKHRIDCNIKYKRITNLNAVVNQKSDIAIIIQVSDGDQLLKLVINNKTKLQKLTENNVNLNEICITDNLLVYLTSNMECLGSFNLYNESKNLMHLNYQIHKICAFENKILLKRACNFNSQYNIDRQQFNNCIVVLNENFEEITSFGQAEYPKEQYYINPALEFYQGFKYVCIKKGYIFINSCGMLTILFEETGRLFKTLNFEKDCFIEILGQDLKILTVSPKDKLAKIYDFDGKLINQFNIKDIENISAISTADNENFIIIDKNNRFVYSN